MGDCISQTWSGIAVFEEQVSLPGMKENIPRKEISHPSEWKALTPSKLHLRMCPIMPGELVHLQGLSLTGGSVSIISA